MAIKYIRIGSMEDIHGYENGDYDAAIETDEPIKSGNPVDPNDVVTLSSLGTMLAGYLKADGTTDLTGDWSISSNSITLVLGLLTAFRAVFNGSTEPMISIEDSGLSNNNREWLQIFNKDNVKMVEIGSITNGNPEIRFGDAENTKVGFPLSDPTYFAFINDETEFWLGNVADPTIYFNYYNGSSEAHGRSANLQGVVYWLTSITFYGNHSTRYIKIIPNTVNDEPVEFEFGGFTTGIFIDDNKNFFFGTGKDASISYDGSDLVIDPQEVGAGGVRILNMKSGATQVAAGAAADELWKTSGHATLPDNVVMIGV